MSSEFSSRLAAVAAEMEGTLAALLDDRPLPGETARPARLMAAMRYAVLGGGKRIRPFLLIETARLFGAGGIGPLRAAAALECVHCYSLAHDDLPVMDDDDMRRGRPSLHRAFDEATALLAGDALLTFAFDILSADETDPDGEVRARLVAGLARAAGLGGMAGGQMLDLGGASANPDAAAVGTMQAMKTGALIRYAVEAGAILGRSGVDERANLMQFGERLGAAFQLADDLIDATQTADTAGKATAKDAARGKATLVAILGVEPARGRLKLLVDEAVGLLEPFGPRGETLREAARFVVRQVEPRLPA